MRPLLEDHREREKHVMRSALLVEQGKGQTNTQTKERTEQSLQQRPYIYELDHMRVLTILCMLATHVLVFAAFLVQDPLETQVLNGFYNAVRFTRTVFMFITAVALVSTYWGKPFSLGSFWRKRGVGVLVPYVIWIIIYTALNNNQRPLWTFLITTIENVLSGDASLQLYYVVLTLQFYLLFPAFLWLLRRTKQHPWTLLGVSFALQLIMYTVAYYTLEAHPPSSGFWSLVAQNLYRFVFSYQFYFVLGGVVALHLSEVRAWVLSHRTWIFVAFGVTLLARTLVYVIEFDLAHLNLDYVTKVLQPVMVFYSVSVIAFLYWLAYRTVGDDQQRQSKRRRFWHTWSDASFGIFLVHPLVMMPVLITVIEPLRSWLPGLVCVALTWLLTVLGSAAWSILFMNLPILSRLVGRSRRMSDPLPLAGWRKRRAAPRQLA